MTRRALRGWTLRLLALAAVVAVLASQLRWHDTLALTDGTTLAGRVQPTPDGAWRVTEPDAASPRVVPDERVARRGTGDEQVPAVQWGMRTLGLRLADEPGSLVIVYLVFALLLSMTAWRWRLLLRAVDVELALPRALRLTWIGGFFNMAIPGATGGDVVKAYYAARTTGRITRSVISVFVDRAIGLIGLALFAGGALLAAPDHPGYGPARIAVLVVLGATALGLAVLATPLLRRGVGLGQLVRKLPGQTLLAEARAALRLYRGRPLALLTALGLSLVNHGAVAACVWLLSRALGIQGLELGMALALVPVANLFAAVPVVPGGWGVGELAFALLFRQVGIPETESIGLSIVYRLSMLVVSLPGGLLWFFWKGRPTREDIRHGMEEAHHRVEEQVSLPEETA